MLPCIILYLTITVKYHKYGQPIQQTTVRQEYQDFEDRFSFIYLSLLGQRLILFLPKEGRLKALPVLGSLVSCHLLCVLNTVKIVKYT